MTYDELVAKLLISDETKIYETLRIFQSALYAVVELHKPCEPVSDDNFVTCETCNYEYHREYPYPCDTIAAIEKELA